jgi:C-terminal processing protease CtpA/Prc
VRQPVVSTYRWGGRVAGSHPEEFEPCPECPLIVDPDPDLQVRLPVAVLTSGLSVSAGDFFAFLMAQEPTARLFGTPTAGGFGNVSVHDPPDGAYSLVVNWSRFADESDVPMQGRSVVPHVVVQPTVADLTSGVDTVMKAAVGWIGEAGGR